MNLIGEVADCLIINWDRKVLAEINKVNIRLSVYTRFKNDILVVTECVEKGTMFVEGKLIVDLVKKTSDET